MGGTDQLRTYPGYYINTSPGSKYESFRRYGWATGFAALGAFFAYFFRDPDRQVPAGEGLVVSPADGRVMIAGPSDGRWSPPGSWNQITIFLSPADVHINRAPVGFRLNSTLFHADQP